MFTSCISVCPRFLSWRVCPSVSLCIHLSVCVTQSFRSSICLSAYLPIHHWAWLSVFLSNCLSICLSVSLFFHHFVSLSVCLSALLSNTFFSICLFVSLSARLFMSVCPFVCAFVFCLFLSFFGPKQKFGKRIKTLKDLPQTPLL